MPRPAPDVVHIGAASRDLTPDDARGWRLGGGVTYASLTTARLGLTTTALIGVDASAASAAELDSLRAAGVDVHLAPLAESPAFRNTETPDGRVQVAIAPGVPLVPRAVPDAWHAARAWSIVPVAGEIGEAWAAHLPDRATAALGWQGMLRTLVAGQRVERRPPTPSALLRRADLVGVSAFDLEPGTDPRDLVAFLRPGARLVVTRGDQGGTIIDLGEAVGVASRTTKYVAFPTGPELDATGAGDTFLAAMLAVTIRPEILGDDRASRDGDVRFAAAAASLTVGAPGLDGIGDLAAVRALVRDEAADRG